MNNKIGEIIRDEEAVWEQRKLGDNIVEYTKKTTENNQYPVLTSSRKGIFFQTDYYDGNQIASVDNTGYNIVPYGYFTYRHMSDDEIFHFNINDITENGIVSTLYPVFTTDENLDSKYLQYQLNHGKEFAKYAILQKQGGSRTYMYLNKLRNLYLTVPTTIEEQKRISEYFTKLDHLITLHQRISLYFLKINTFVWEQRKLGDLLEDMYNGQTPSRNKCEYWNGDINWLSSGELNRGTVYSSIELITEEGQKSANLRIIPKGTFVMAITGLEAAGTRGNCALLGFDTTLNQSCMALFPKKDLLTSEFLFQWYRKVGEEYGLNYTQGTKQQSYNAELIKILPISVPSIKEQRRIASSLSSLDHLITLHQRKPYFWNKFIVIDWEQRKLKEIADKVSEKNKNNEFSEPFTNSAEQGIISQKDYFDREIVNNENLDSYYIVRNDDFIYNPRISVTAPVGPINRNRLGRNGVMSPLYTIFRTHDMDNLYLEFYFKTTKWHRFMKLNGDSGARFDRFTISSTQFMEMPIPYPTLEEQSKIGRYFDSLDHLITLHQRKCEETKILKKYMLQKMFPQNGHSVPEIRFSGFTEDWEQRKLGDVAQEFKSGNSLKADEIDITGDYPVYGGNGLRGYTSTYNHDGEYALIGRQGALCGNMNYSVGKAYFTEHAVVVKADENNDTRFLYYMLDTMNLGQYSDQSAQPGLAVNKLVKLENRFPTKEEQQRMGWYFSNIDHLITLHQRKCKELQNIKKYMLQNMFV